MVCIFALIILWLWERDSFERKVRKIDNDPSYKIKSDKWKREHGLL